MINKVSVSAFIVAVAACLSGAAWADEAAATGRTILEKNRSAVVTVRLVIKTQFSMQGGGTQESEAQTEVTGTVIDGTGLTVVSLTETDPAGMLNAMYADRGFQMQTTINDIKILKDDGSEVDAKVVLRDTDFDIAFIRPSEQPSAPLPSVDTSKAGMPEMLDSVVFLNRLGKIANRAYSASLDRVEAIVEKPRKFFIPGRGDSSAALGSPCFTLDGQFVGVALLRTVAGASSMFSDSDDTSMAIIRPVADILEAGTQVPPFGQEPPEPVEVAPEPTDGAAPDAPAEEAPAEGPADVSITLEP